MKHLEIHYIGAEWCGKCATLKPIVSTVADRLTSNPGVSFLFYNYDTCNDDIKAILDKHNVMSLPVLIFSHKGEIQNPLEVISGKVLHIQALEDIVMQLLTEE